MSKGTKIFVKRNASLVVDVKRVSKDSKLAKESHVAHVAKTDSKTLYLRGELHLVNADHYVVSKDLNK